MIMQLNSTFKGREEIFVNIIRNLKVDLDRIELFSDMGYEYNVDEYKDLKKCQIKAQHKH